MSKKVRMIFRADIKVELSAEEASSYTTMEIRSIAGAIHDALEAMMDGSDVLHDYVGEAIPDGVEVREVSLGEVALSAMRDWK